MIGPGANVATVEWRLVEERLSTLLDELGAVAPDACCAGAAGAEVPAAGARLHELLAQRFPGSRVCVVHDSRLILAAAGLDAGIALVAGTGSVGYARARDGQEAQRGGWGWMVGDEGSGVWITREAARLVMTRAQNGYPIGTLGDALLASTGASDPAQLIANLHSMHEAMEWAALAETVFATEDSDDGSREIVHRAAKALSELVVPLLRRCPDGPVVLAGGILLNRPTLEAGVRKMVPVECVRLEAPPVEGALRLAEGLLR